MNGFPKQTSNMLENVLKQHFGVSIRIQALESVGGGCINQARKVTLSDGSVWFIKLSQASRVDMFAAESAGLHAIRATSTIYAPEPISYGTEENSAYLILEYLDLRGGSQSRQAGEQLAAMHQHTAECFGWFRDNTIGSTTQRNREHDDWLAFWRQERLGFQLKLAKHNAYPLRAYEQGMELAENLDVFFSGYRPQASLLHGDLWGGNMAFTKGGRPVIFDPAVYYGDREADLAMTELFGGFDSDFYAAYNATWPLDAGYETRKALYNLYHILNHFNLFGGGYGMQAARMTESLLAQSK